MTGCDLDAPAGAWHLPPMQMLRTIAAIALVLSWGAFAAIKAPAMTGMQEVAVSQSLTAPSGTALPVMAVLSAAPAEGRCDTALPGTPCHSEHLLPPAAGPCGRKPARESRCIDRSRAGAGQNPLPIYRPPRFS